MTMISICCIAFSAMCTLSSITYACVVRNCAAVCVALASQVNFDRPAKDIGQFRVEKIAHVGFLAFLVHKPGSVLFVIVESLRPAEHGTVDQQSSTVLLCTFCLLTCVGSKARSVCSAVAC